MSQPYNPKNASDPVNKARRGFLIGSGLGMGSLAFAHLLRADNAFGLGGKPKAPTAVDIDRGALGTGQITPRAKRVLWIHQYGSFSQLDTFDYKPTLIKMHGQEIPPSVKNAGGRISAMTGAQASFPLIKPMRPFAQHGQSGAWVSELFPHIAGIVDEVAFIKSMWTEQVNHDPAQKFLHTGFQLSGRPTHGAWMHYALGTDNANLPSYVGLVSMGTRQGMTVDSGAFASGFLPSHHQGVLFRSGDDPVHYVNSPEAIDRQQRRAELDLISTLSHDQYQNSGDPEILSKLSQYEMAYRMQESVPEIADITNEPQHILDMYGPDVHKPGTFAKNCLIARRLLERDVKFVQMMQVGWDHHANMEQLHPIDCLSADQATAGLIMDLKQRGLLDDTLVVWGSEFGRTAFAQGQLSSSYGRDHHGSAFTYMLAGAGIKPGVTYGRTDDFGYNIVENPVSIHDLHATMLDIMGIDHEQLIYHYQGRDFRLTDVSGESVKGILA